MKTITKALLLITFFVMMLFLSSCEKTTEPQPNDISEANAIARQGFDLMNDEADRLSTVEDISTQDDVLLESKFDEIEAKFQKALEYDDDNPMANLGMSILEILRLNYDPEFWALQDDMQDFGNLPKSLLNHQFEFLSRVPSIMVKNYTMDSKSVLSIKRFQDFIINSVNPRLESSLGYLNKAVNLADSSAIMIDTGEEFVEIDCGEIYAYRASIKLLNAAFYMLTAYNWDLIGADGTYNWIDQTNADYAPASFNPDQPYNYTVENQVAKLHYWDYWDRDEYSMPYRDEVAAKTLKHNLENNPAFATLNQTRLTKAKNNILGAAADLTSGIDYIENETDDQSNDIIKLQYISDLNEDISNHDPDNPPFMQSWTEVGDVIDWLESLISGGNFTTTTPDDIEFTVNLSAFFNGAIPDLKDVKPYYHWNSSTGTWLELESNMGSWETSSYSFYYYNDLIVLTSLTSVEEYGDYHKLNAGYFTNASGVEIADGETPYFPDYTFGGMFPNMTRTKFIQLFGN